MKTWIERDLPVLTFLNEHPPEHALLWTNWVSDAPHEELASLTEQDVHYAVETLADAGYVTFDKKTEESGGGVGWIGFQVSGGGKQVLGDWPMFEGLGQPAELAAVLSSLADYAESDEEEGNLRKASEAVGILGRDALQALAAGALGEAARRELGE